MSSHTAAGASTVLNVITGPTAAGKSAIAMELAKQFNLAIISADSRQIYRGFDIGTAKPDATDRADVPHFGIDIVEPTLRYSAHAWATDVAQWIPEAAAISRAPLIVGGTGFYIRSLVRPLAPAPTLDEGRRLQLERWLSNLELNELQRWCAELDPVRAGLGRTQLLRAIETALLSGTRLSDAHAEQARASGLRAAGVSGAQSVNAAGSSAESMQVRYLVVDPGPPLADRIRRRVHDMMDGGWVSETENLMQSVPSDAPAWLSSGYGTVQAHVRGELSRAEMIERVTIETRQYAKRQRTWCRHQLTEGPVTRISPLEPDARDRAVAWWQGTESTV